jgi:hypothetical protein
MDVWDARFEWMEKEIQVLNLEVFGRLNPSPIWPLRTRPSSEYNNIVFLQFAYRNLSNDMSTSICTEVISKSDGLIVETSIVRKMGYTG